MSLSLTKRFLPVVCASLFLSFVFLAIAPAFAAEDGNAGNPVKISVTLQNPFKIGNNLYDVAKNIVNGIVLQIGGILCILAFIYSGFLYVTAGGSDTKVKNAHNALINSAIGTALLLGAWALVTLVQTTINSIARP